MLEVSELEVRYGRITAVRRISLRVQAGEIVGLIGSNGAGKSSTLGAIAGMVPCAGGSVTIESVRIDRLPPEEIVRHGVALVPENRRLFPYLTVEENLKLGTTARADRAAARADIDRELQRFPALARLRRARAGSLSGGEQQQLAIARALLCGPKLLLLDEPSLGLAPVLVDLVFKTITQLRDQGITIVLAEQFVARTLRVADRVYALDRGTVAASGTVDEVRAATDFKAQYLHGGDRGVGVGQ